MPKALIPCVANRPCRRCVSLDKQDTCVDVQHKRRGRPRLKDSTPSTGSLHSEQRRPSYHRHVSDDSWKLQSSPYGRETLRRDYHHHNRSFSQGSHSVASRYHPYGIAPTSGSPIGSSRNTSGYFDLPSPASTAPAYNAYPAPNSPNYYSYSSPQLTGRQSKDSMPSPHSHYLLTSSARPDSQYPGPPTRSQPLLPLPDSSHPSFPTNLRQSESDHYPQRGALLRTGSSPAAERHRLEHGGHPETNDSVKLPSLKDLGVPFH